MTGIRTIVLSAAISLLLTGCNSRMVWSEYQAVDGMNWAQDSALRFAIPVTDTSAKYNLIVHIRHTERYPFQNMWLFIQPEKAMADTIEFYLADERGQWLGNGRGGLFDMPVLYEENIHFPDTGTYVVTVQHGMRTEALNGVADIGIELSRYGEE